MTFLMILSVMLLSMLRILLCQQLELGSELESNLQDTVDWGRKRLVEFDAGKTQLVSLDRSNNTGDIDLKMNGPVLEEIPS